MEVKVEVRVEIVGEVRGVNYRRGGDVGDMRGWRESIYDTLSRKKVS